MDQLPDWVSMVNVNLSDHETRLQMLESAVSAVDLDDGEYTWPPGNVAGYDLRTAAERQSARLANPDQRLRAIEHRLLLIEVEIRELVDAIKSANGL